MCQSLISAEFTGATQTLIKCMKAPGSRGKKNCVHCRETVGKSRYANK